MDLALSELATHKAEPTPSNIFKSYMRLAGYTELCREAVHSFERAMEKYPCDKSVVGVAMENIRREYWANKLGLKKPGDLVEYLDGGEDERKGHLEPEPEPQPTRRRKKRTAKTKMIKTVRAVKHTRPSSPSGESDAASSSTSGSSQQI
ncbi:hypothetical protein GLOTRDRAFT_139362 [Gloeophyllum trabeum ATCC 11539]|uniref:Uncharacterized protein n=1 Tax=Gloeophyllum trabeum (strain ATCC 11539 / FP-39264 / Madison 617) TaxID=670483 RepID=S7RPU6_GLOTA|nr:uncharacterized protein GLOTRDRAFT_139362 [Gloeophyllum trabeum ATCC 11539]EPQ54909.1 hypothetical protein GLOTRDRAFT_139362 [Gloeophyllum trabeum ATCC 11539]